MIVITLPDGSTREFPEPPSAYSVAASIGKGLAAAALAARVDGELRDLHRPIEHSATLSIITRDSGDALALLRHDCAHIMAEAVQDLYPGTQITFGPATDTGFYYDFAGDTPFSTEDFPKIEARMREIIAADTPLEREVWPRAQAIAHFRAAGEIYKAEHIESLPADEEITIYRQGAWLDLCRGPHLPSTGRVGTAFKLMKLSGAYWRGDARNAQLQRIYGTCWRDEKELKAYLFQLEEAERRDHRRLGRVLDLFHIQEEAPGGVFWHPHGWMLYRTIVDYMRRRLDRAGYKEVNTPQLLDRALWEMSGHWDKFREHMFIAQVDESVSGESVSGESVPDESAPDESVPDESVSGEGQAVYQRTMALKPMNCPCHVQIFRHGITSYRELPLRMSEFGSCHRYEPSGALHGLMRVRAFTQDDGHIFCTEEQIVSETRIFCDLLRSVYTDFGFTELSVKLADRPAVRAGDDEVWDHAERALAEATERAGIPYEVNPGEGAFYGPKLEFVLRDAIGRDWQCGTLQVDFVLPQRLGAVYIDRAGQKCPPVMLHRAILGSFERFTGIVIEQYAGRLPLWLMPVQVVVATITSQADAYAHEVAALVRAAGLRVEVDTRNEKISYKIRAHTHRLVPVILVAGTQEVAARTLAVRRLGARLRR